MLAALMVIGPLLRWRRDAAPILPRLASRRWSSRSPRWSSASSSRRDIGLLPRLGLALGAGLAAGQPAAAVRPHRCAARRSPSGAWSIAHFGVAVALLGMAVGQRLHPGKAGGRAARRDGSRSARGWSSFAEVEPVAGPNWTALEAELRASRGAGVVVLKPQSRYFTDPPTEHQRSRDRHQLERPALRRARRARTSRAAGSCGCGGSRS